MGIAATKEVQTLFGQFEHAYFERPDDVDVLLHRVMAVATCLDRLRSEGCIGAYLGGMDSIDRLYRENAERTLMEDPRDPVVMKAIAEHFPIHTMTGLNFFMKSSDEVMQAAIRSYAAHMQVRSAFTLKNDAASVVRYMAVNGLHRSVDDFLGLMEEISSHDPQIMPPADFGTTLCGAFEGIYDAEAPFAVSKDLHRLVEVHLKNKESQFQISYPNIESAMGLAKAGYHDLAIDIAKSVFPRARKLDDQIIIRMEQIGMKVEPILNRVAQKPTAGWAEAYLAYTLQTERKDLEVNPLSLADSSVKGAAKRMLIKICVQDRFNQTAARSLMAEYGRLYPDEGRDFYENPKLKPLAITVGRYREAAIGSDLGL